MLDTIIRRLYLLLVMVGLGFVIWWGIIILIGLFTQRVWR